METSNEVCRSPRSMSMVRIVFYRNLSYSTALAICSLAPRWKPRAAARRQTTPTNKVFQSIRPSGLSLHPSEHKTAPASHRKSDFTQKGSNNFECTSSVIQLVQIDDISFVLHIPCPTWSFELLREMSDEQIQMIPMFYNYIILLIYQALMTSCHHSLIRSFWGRWPVDTVEYA